MRRKVELNVTDIHKMSLNTKQCYIIFRFAVIHSCKTPSFSAAYLLITFNQLLNFKMGRNCIERDVDALANCRITEFLSTDFTSTNTKNPEASEIIYDCNPRTNDLQSRKELMYDFFL